MEVERDIKEWALPTHVRKPRSRARLASIKAANHVFSHHSAFVNPPPYARINFPGQTKLTREQVAVLVSY
jgi:hypothetical protein